MGGLLLWFLLIGCRSSLNGVGLRCISACAKNLGGGVENALGRTLTDGLASAPRLDIAPAIFRAWQSKRFAAKQGHGFGFHLPDIPWCALGVRKVAFINMAKHYVGGFMEERFYRESRNRADRDLPATFRVSRISRGVRSVSARSPSSIWPSITWAAS